MKQKTLLQAQLGIYKLSDKVSPSKGIQPKVVYLTTNKVSSLALAVIGRATGKIDKLRLFVPRNPAFYPWALALCPGICKQSLSTLLPTKLVV